MAIIDPERAPLIRWAFEQYALGTWTLRRLTDAQEAQGLTTRPTRKRVAKPVSLNGVNVILRNPYYMGVVPYRGVYHEGKHEPLVSAELWLRVQDVLSAHHLAGDKEFKHHHYLKGSIFCSECGARLVFTRNRGHGGVYEYYDCLSKKTRRRPCSRRLVRLEKIERGVVRFYASFRITRAKAEQIRAGVLDELAATREDAAHEEQRARKRLRDVAEQQAKLLHAHYAGAVPLELMKSEMARLTREKSEAERSLASSQLSVQKVEGTLDAALAIASTCDRQYLTAEPQERRMLNQGFFKKLFIGEDGEVEHFELTEPFATLMDRSLLADLARAREEGQAASADATPSKAGETEAEERSRPSNVLVNTFACPLKTDKPDGGAVRLGLNVYGLVHLIQGLSNADFHATGSTQGSGEFVA